MYLSLFSIMNDGMYIRVALNRQPSTAVNSLSMFGCRQHFSISFTARIFGAFCSKGILFHVHVHSFRYLTVSEICNQSRRRVGGKRGEMVVV
jgi:hypothetical protein